jgi:glycosyltransferase 2 family protein
VSDGKAPQLINRIRRQTPSVGFRRAARLVLAGVVLLAALYYLLHVASGVDFGSVLTALANAKLMPLAVAVACQVGFLLFQSLRWRGLLPKLETIGMLRTVGLLSIGNMINMLLPLRSGDIARPFLAVRCAQVPLSRAAAAAVAERALDVVVLGAMAVVVPLKLGLGLYYVAAALVGSAVLLAYLLRKFTEAHPDGTDRLAANLSGLFGWVKKAYQTTLNAFADIADPRAVLLALAWTIVSFAFAMGTYVFALLALEITLTPLSLISLFVVTQLGSAIPSAPASIGVFDALAVALLVSSGVSDQEALSAALLLHAVLVAVPVGFGLAATAFEGGSVLQGATPAQQSRLLDKRSP